MLISRGKLLLVVAALCAFAALPKHADAQLIGVLQQQAQRHAATGTPSIAAISYSTVASTTSSPSGSVSVPANADYAVVFVDGWTSAADRTLTASSVTLGSVSFTEALSKAEGGPNIQSDDVWYADVSSVAGTSQTLSASRAGTVTEGGHLIIVWVADVNTSTPVRDSDIDICADAGGFNDVTITLTTTVGDLVVGYVQDYSTTPTAQSGYTQLGSVYANNTHSMLIVWKIATGSSESLAETQNEFPSVGGIVLEPQ
jgi:hypothetical protein